MHTIGFPVLTVALFLILAGGAFVFDALSAHHGERIPLKRAVRRSVGFVLVGVAFGLWVTLYHGHEDGMRFFAGFLMEKALSVDNLMVFTAVFAYFGIPAIHQRRILQYGIAGAVVFRFLFLAGGIGLFLSLGPVTEFAFGCMVLWSAYAVMQDTPPDEDFDSKWYVKLMRRIWPVAARGDVFFVQDVPAPHSVDSSMTYMTKAFLCLVTIEVSDIMFSFDSVPAVIGITQDPFLIYAAVIFAVLGLRALYFVLEGLTDMLHHLGKAVAVVLVFIGLKLIGHAVWGFHIGPLVNIAIVGGVLTLGVLASLYDSEPEAA